MGFSTFWDRVRMGFSTFTTNAKLSEKLFLTPSYAYLRVFSFSEKIWVRTKWMILSAHISAVVLYHRNQNTVLNL